LEKRQICKIKAKELVHEYMNKNMGCSVSTFLAIINSLKGVGVDFIKPEVENEIVKSLVGFDNGIGNMSIGTCGPVTAASFIISLASKTKCEEMNIDLRKARWIPYYYIKEGIGKELIESYGTIVCRGIQLKSFGMSWDIIDEERKNEFRQYIADNKCLQSDVCPIVKVAMLGVDAVLDIMEKDEDLSNIMEKYGNM
jgi:hypothetical protein